MAETALQYQVPPELDFKQLNTSMGKKWGLREDPQARLTQRYYDSFDWRLYQGGLVLLEEAASNGSRLQLLDRVNGDLIAEMPLEGSTPGFAWDFPKGPIWQRLSGLLEMRSLLPQVQISCQRHTLRLLDGEQKTVCRLWWDDRRAKTPNCGGLSPIDSLLRLRPLKGYDKELGKATVLLEQKLGLTPLPNVSLGQDLRSLGRKPADYSSKLNFKLDPSGRADLVLRQVCLHLLKTLETNIPGTRKDLDSEFLHDLRVSVRRTRSMLTQVKAVFPEEIVEQYKQGFAWLGQVTGPTRDMDVYLLAFEEYQQSLPLEYRDDLEPLRQYLITHQRQEQQALSRKLASPHFYKLLKEWNAFLESAPPEQAEPANAMRPIIKVASRRIAKMYERVMREGRAITDQSPAEDLHEMRISCKKLRYLMEFFQSLYPAKQIQPLIKIMKQLLDNLGDFQDLEVQAHKLQGFAHEMAHEGKIPIDTMLAMGMLVDGLLKRQQEQRHLFAERFAPLELVGNRECFGRLFGARI